MKLNLGCGNHKLDGFVNVDNSPHCQPDKLVDLQAFPWPFADNCADEIIMSHVLEHIGQQTDIFERIIKELYRIAKPSCPITIGIPDPYHDNFWGDFTHCRPITPQAINLLSRSYLGQFTGSAMTPLAFMWEVDFKVVKVNSNVDPDFAKFAKANHIPLELSQMRYYRNAILDHIITIEAQKPPRS